MRYFFMLMLGCVILQSCKQKPQNTRLIADKRYVESLNRWTALYTGKDSVYLYGYIYVDPRIGLAVHNEGSFKITGNNVYVPTKLGTGAMATIHLKNNKTKIAWIPENKFDELQISAKPHWLDTMKIDTTAPGYLLKMAFVYNEGHDNALALSYLERVKKIDPNYPGLDFEYAYYYDVLHRYDKAEALLRKSLAERPGDFGIYKELIYEEVFSNNMTTAEQTYKQALPHCTTEQKAELAYNICLIYYQQKNKLKLGQWAVEAKKWVAPGTKQMDKLRNMISSPMK